MNHLFWDTFQNLIQSTNNCATGCSCIDDRYEITHARVRSWVASAEAKSRDVLVSGLNELRASKFSGIDLDQLEEMTNLPFKSEKDAATWLNVWLYLLTNEKMDHSLHQQNVWLDAGLEGVETVYPVEKEELIDATLSINGQLDWLTKDHRWQSLARTPLKSKIPNNLCYRFIAEPGIFEAELEEGPFDEFAPGLIDLRLTECHSLTDECIQSLTRLQNLRILSLGSLQIQGETLHLLSRLENVKRLDLVGCKNLSRSAIDQLQVQRKDLKILSSL